VIIIFLLFYFRKPVLGFCFLLLTLVLFLFNLGLKYQSTQDLKVPLALTLKTDSSYRITKYGVNENFVDGFFLANDIFAISREFDSYVFSINNNEIYTYPIDFFGFGDLDAFMFCQFEESDWINSTYPISNFAEEPNNLIFGSKSGVTISSKEIAYEVIDQENPIYLGLTYTKLSFIKSLPYLIESYFGSSITRVYANINSLNLFIKKPYFGYGLGTWLVNSYSDGTDSYFEYSPILTNINFISRTDEHNIYFKYLSELGFFGFLLFMIPVYYYRRSIKFSEQRLCKIIFIFIFIFLLNLYASLQPNINNYCPSFFLFIFVLNSIENEI